MWRHLLSRVALLFLLCLFVLKLRSHIALVNYRGERFVSIVLRLQYITVRRMLVYVDARFVFGDFVLVTLDRRDNSRFYILSIQYFDSVGM